MESLSLELNYSPQYLTRKFKEQTGFSPIEYVIKLRIEKAQFLLLTTDATLQEIALNVGYSDLFYFNRIFKNMQVLHLVNFEINICPIKVRVLIIQKSVKKLHC